MATATLLTGAAPLGVFEAIAAVVLAEVGLFTGGIALGESDAADLAELRAEPVQDTAAEVPGSQNRASATQDSHKEPSSRVA